MVYSGVFRARQARLGCANASRPRVRRQPFPRAGTSWRGIAMSDRKAAGLLALLPASTACFATPSADATAVRSTVVRFSAVFLLALSNSAAWADDAPFVITPDSRPRGLSLESKERVFEDASA